jgi:hypothetical protein
MMAAHEIGRGCGFDVDFGRLQGQLHRLGLRPRPGRRVRQRRLTRRRRVDRRPAARRPPPSTSPRSCRPSTPDPESAACGSPSTFTPSPEVPLDHRVRDRLRPAHRNPASAGRASKTSSTTSAKSRPMLPDLDVAVTRQAKIGAARASGSCLARRSSGSPCTSALRRARRTARQAGALGAEPVGGPRAALAPVQGVRRRRPQRLGAPSCVPDCPTSLGNAPRPARRRRAPAAAVPWLLRHPSWVAESTRPLPRCTTISAARSGTRRRRSTGLPSGCTSGSAPAASRSPSKDAADTVTLECETDLYGHEGPGQGRGVPGVRRGVEQSPSGAVVHADVDGGPAADGDGDVAGTAVLLGSAGDGVDDPGYAHRPVVVARHGGRDPEVGLDEAVVEVAGRRVAAVPGGGRAGPADRNDGGGGIVKPPFAYYGGKTRLAEQIAGLLPAARALRRAVRRLARRAAGQATRRMETVNDLDGDLMTFWRVLRDRPTTCSGCAR